MSEDLRTVDSGDLCPGTSTDMFSSQSVPPNVQTPPGETRCAVQYHADDLSILVLRDMNPRAGESVTRMHGRRTRVPSMSCRTTGRCDGIYHRLQDGGASEPAECGTHIE